jgi:lactate permease
MSLSVLALVAFLPIAIALVLMAGLRWPATKAMPLAWLACVLGALLVWNLPAGYIAALSVQGVISAFFVAVTLAWLFSIFSLLV